MSAIGRGFINPFRNKARTVVVVVLLSFVTGFLALMVQATAASRQQITSMEGRVRTLIELREAGAFGTGGFGGDKPIGEVDFSVETLAKALRIPSAAHLARVDEYVYKPQVDPSKKNAYAMVIGLHPGAALRAIGEIDYENARIIAGRSLAPGDENANVAIAGRLYAAQRLDLADPSALERADPHVAFNGRTFRVIGIYTTANDFGDKPRVHPDRRVPRRIQSRQELVENIRHGRFRSEPRARRRRAEDHSVMSQETRPDFPRWRACHSRRMTRARHWNCTAEPAMMTRVPG